MSGKFRPRAFIAGCENILSHRQMIYIRDRSILLWTLHIQIC